MVESKAWDWNAVEKDAWIKPCEESYYLANKWKSEGVHSILDLGCGRGRHSVFFTKMGFNVTAVDLSEDAVLYAKEWSKKEGIDFICKLADMKALPFEDNAFDAVFSYHVISHTDTNGIINIITEIKRILKPGGKLFLTLCSKNHCAYTDKANIKIDENTVLKTEGAEQNVPHFFVDEAMIPKIMHEYTTRKIRHICECDVNGNTERQKSHYYIEAELLSKYVNH